MITGESRSLLGGNWGHGMFQLNACNYCDDIFAEAADVVFGDAWLAEYTPDWRGTNVVVNRNAIVAEILKDGVADGSIELDSLSASKAAESQSGNYRHRRIGLSVRLADDRRAQRWVPRKRVEIGYEAATRRRIRVIRARRELTAVSQKLFQEAKQRDSLDYFVNAIGPFVRAYDRSARPNLLRRAKRVTQRAFATVSVGRLGKGNSAERS